MDFDHFPAAADAEHAAGLARRMATLGLVVCSVLGLVSCASAASAPTVTLFKSLGTRQCETGGPAAADLAAPLRAAGLSPVSVGCGSDGRMRPMVCGAPDGRLAIVELPAEQQAAAEALGFAPLATLPDARRQPCPVR